MVAAGRLGRKAGRGYYDYGGGPHRARGPSRSRSHAESDRGTRSRFDRGPGLRRGQHGRRARSSAFGASHRHPWDEIERLRRSGSRVGVVNFIALPGLKTARAVDSRALLKQSRRHSTRWALFPSLGKHVEWVPGDAPGPGPGPDPRSDRQRGALRRAAEGVASAEDCDTAMRLGFNWPRGPFEWAAAIGLGRVVRILDALHGTLGEERYRVCAAPSRARRFRLSRAVYAKGS